MVANLVLTPQSDTLATYVAGELIRVERDFTDLRVVLPIVYPSGRWCSVKIIARDNAYIVTDDGDGASEADLMAALPHYLRIAPAIARRRGIAFNDYELFEANASRGQLIGMVIIVAEAAREAVAKTAEWLVDSVARAGMDSLEEKLIAAFGEGAVKIGVEYVASSSHAWQFDALVTTRTTPLLIATVVPKPASVYAAFTKFEDVRLSDDAPIGVAAIGNVIDFESHQLVLLRRTAKIREIAAPADEWRALAA